MSDNLADVLRDIVSGMANPTFVEVAQMAQDLTEKQVKESWAERHDPNRDPWAALHGESFAGLSKKSGRRSSRAHLDMAAAADIRRGITSDQGFESRGQMPRYAFWQNDGTTSTGWGTGIAPREFWAFAEDTLDLVAALLAEKAAKNVAEG